jgi:uncharacterized protein YhbP (UPF0306 family)
MNDTDRTRGEIAAFLAAHSTLTLATVDAAGRPMAASLFYVSDASLRLHWVSGAHSRHSANVQRSGTAALTVHGETWSWTDIAGVQMEGAVAVVPAGAPWQLVWDQYRTKFPFVDEFQAEVSRSNFYAFTPRWARLIDNGRGFGFKRELKLD